MSQKQVNEFKEIVPKYTNKWYNFAIDYVNRYFPNNFGYLTMDNLSSLPCNYYDA
jgi:hypothetical protein